MKKLFMIATMMLLSIGAFAQDGKMAFGVDLGYAAYGNSYNPLGLGAKFQYEFVENFRGELSGDYWFKKNSVGLWDANLNFQYLFSAAEDVKIYPLAGVTLVGTHGIENGGNETAFGFNAGAGVEYYLDANLKLNLDIKYQYAKKSKDISEGGYTFSYDVIKVSGPVFQLGIAYVF